MDEWSRIYDVLEELQDYGSWEISDDTYLTLGVMLGRSFER